MNRLMQTASVLSFAAALAAAPVVATAQQQTTETEVEQAVEGTAQEAQEAAGEATEAVGEAAQEAEQAVEGTTEATEEQADALENQADAVEEQSEEQADAVEEQSEEQADAIEQQGEQQSDALEDQADAVEEQAVDVEVVEGEEPVEEVQGAIVMQDENSILAGDLIGATIYNSAGETVGEVDDAIISLDGTIEGVVIGVGGFLGLGEKNVAVEMAQISVQTDEDGDPQLVLDTTRESLEAAPEFVTVEDQQGEAQATTATMPPAGGTAPAAGGMAPAGQAPAAPAEGTGTTGGATAPTQ